MVQTKCIVKHITQTKFSIGELQEDTIQTFDTDCGKIELWFVMMWNFLNFLD
jgi:hypothetical protein